MEKGNRMRILIIDDSKKDRELVITYILQSNNGSNKKIKTDESNCMQNALSKLDMYDYDVIILDLSLPESDGIETIQQIQSKLKEKSKKTPIVVLTGHEDYKVGIKAFTLGIKDFLLKDEIQEKDLSRALNLATYNTPMLKI